MRVLLISHTCQSRTEGQPKAHALARLPDVELRVLVPNRWRRYGAWRAAQTPAAPPFQWEVGRIAWPWAGPAQTYCHWYPALAETLTTFRPDIIDLWEEPWGLVSAHTCWLRNRLLPQARIVSETEQNINKSLPVPFEQFRSYTLKNADMVVGRNNEAIAVLRAKGYTGPAQVIPNAVDAALFRPLDRECCRRALGVSGFVAGYVGRFVEEKGLMDMVDALPYCSAQVNLLFIGSGPYQAQLEQRARELGKAAQVRFLPNRPLEQLPEIMNALDVLALPSRTTAHWKEQFGRVLIEASACEIPVIGSDSGAIPDVIGGAGVVVPERNPECLAAAVNALAVSPERRWQLGKIGRAQVEAHYTWDGVARQMESLYRSVLPVDVPIGEVCPSRP